MTFRRRQYPSKRPKDSGIFTGVPHVTKLKAKATIDRRRSPAPNVAIRATAAARRGIAVERRKIERRVKVARRRQIDPTTCEREYTDEEIEFMHALEAYKRSSGRMFPTCSEVLEVLRGLGYERTEPMAKAR